MENFLKFLKENGALIVFWITFCASIALSFIGVLTPPPGIIDASVIEVIRDLLLFSAFMVLAVKNILGK